MFAPGSEEAIERLKVRDWCPALWRLQLNALALRLVEGAWYFLETHLGTFVGSNARVCSCSADRPRAAQCSGFPDGRGLGMVGCCCLPYGVTAAFALWDGHSWLEMGIPGSAWHKSRLAARGWRSWSSFLFEDGDDGKMWMNVAVAHINQPETWTSVPLRQASQSQAEQAGVLPGGCPNP